MAEYIEREDAINLFWPVDPENDGSDGCTVVLKCGHYNSNEIEAMLSDLPAANVAEVVRCAQCKHAKESKDAFDWDGKTPLCECAYMTQPNRWHEYCSWGKRKEAALRRKVAEVRHGRWIPEICESISKRNRLIEYKVYSCSLCGRSNGRIKKKYCPNCGALMKEDEHG